MFKLLRKVPKVFDFRSDTVTLPTAAMFTHMLQAKLGDDVYQEDTSTIELERYIANLSGHEEGLFCCTGTMSNQLALRSWLNGALQGVILDRRSHIFKYENAGIAFFSQAGTQTVSPSNGRLYLTWDRIEPSLTLEQDVHSITSKVVCLENTLNGCLMPFKEASLISNESKKLGLVRHLDGARLWNASIESGVSLKEWCSLFDSVSLCLSKGIGAPMGSILVGPSTLIQKARHYRKLFGGGWRQSGIMAAAAHHAVHHTFVENNGEVIRKDHQNAKWLANEIKNTIPGVCILNEPVETNMLFIDLSLVKSKSGKYLTVKNLVDQVAENSVKDGGIPILLPSWGYSWDDGTDKTMSRKQGNSTMRLVIHQQVPMEACQRLISLLKTTLC